MFNETGSRSWPLPKDGFWRQSTLRGIVESGQRLWLDCRACGRSRYLETQAWVDRHRLQADLDTPLLLLARRLVCQRCHRRGVAIKAESYGNMPARDERRGCWVSAFYLIRGDGKKAPGAGGAEGKKERLIDR